MNGEQNNDNPSFFILASANRLKAYLRIENANDEFELKFDDVMAKLKEMNITFGIDEEAIKKYCEERDFKKELTVASGKQAVKGEDARIDYNFNTDTKLKFKEKADGSVDFKDLNNIKSIDKDGLVCKKIIATKGIDGTDIYGNPIAPKAGKDITLPTGKNTYISEDGLSLFSSVTGAANLGNNRIDIEDVYTVQSVDQTTGNIDFKGSVVVKGDVNPGFKIIAAKDIQVHGMVEGADLEAGGDIVINNGINGQDVSKIYAKGSITGKYLENAELIAGHNIYSNEIINCIVKAGNNIILKGNVCAIIGGNCMAEGNIVAKAIGTKNNLMTKVGIDLSEFFEAQKNHKKLASTLSKLKIDLMKKKNELDGVNSNIDKLSKMISRDEKTEKLYKLLILKRAELNKEVKSMEVEITELDTSDKIDLLQKRIICSGTIFTNTHVEIGWLKHIVRQDLNYSKIYNDGNEIQISMLTSADLSVED